MALGVVVTRVRADARPPPRHRASPTRRDTPRYVPAGPLDARCSPTPCQPTRCSRGSCRPLLEDPAVRKLSAHAKRDLLVLGRRGRAGGGPRLRRARRLLPAQSRPAHLHPRRPRVRVPGRAPRLTARTGSRGDDASADATAKTAGAGRGPRAPPGRADEPARSRRRAWPRSTQTMELPLVEVLADMERAGVKIDRDLLATMSRDMERQLADPDPRDPRARQGRVQHQLSDPAARGALRPPRPQERRRRRPRRGPPPPRRTCSRSWPSSTSCPARSSSTGRSRSSSPPTSTRCPSSSTRETGRIHASFNQTVAATGRISSSDPNLQNIPIRTAEGRRIREAFVAEPGHLLLSADYSQIELRILAHLSKDQTLIDTFRRGEDVHDRTSREVFGPLSPVPPDEQRRVSKMVNYALLYGKTAFTLAKDIGVVQEGGRDLHRGLLRPLSRRCARFIDETIVKARETGHVRTLLGRLRRLPDLRAKNFQVRMEAERQAMNTPVQGSAADLIKKAMIDLHRELRRAEAGLAADPADPRRAAARGAGGRSRDGAHAREGGDGGGAPARRAAGGGRPSRPQLGRGALIGARSGLGSGPAQS